MPSLCMQCVILFFLGFAADVLQTWHIQACTNRNVGISVFTLWGIFLVGFFGHKWFVEQKSSWARWWITVASALGAGAGTALAIIF